MAVDRHRSKSPHGAARFRPLSPGEAPGRAGELLGGLVGRNGHVGVMVATMAHSPAVLAGYLELSQTCLDAHVEAARRVRVGDQEIEAAHTADSADAAVAALLRFAMMVLTEPAGLDDADIVDLLDHGYSEQEVLDVVGIVALNQLTGSFNLVVGL